jgi:hypothetical protein
MTPPLSPEHLKRLLDDAVRPVTPQAGAFERIRHGVRRRRTAHRAGAVLLTAAVIAGGTAIALVVTPGAGPARVGAVPPPASVASSASVPSPAAVSSSGFVSSSRSAPSPGAKTTLPPGQTRTAALPSASQHPQPSAAPSSARPSAAPSTAPSAQPSATPSAASPASQPTTAAASPSALPSPDRPAAADATPSLTAPAAWAINGFGQSAARVTIVPVGNAKTTASFLLVVHTAANGTQAVPFAATPQADMPPFGPVVVGAANAAKDGHTELFVLVDAGCCTEFWTIFRVVDGHVVQVSLAGAPVRLAVGGSVMDNGGFSCNGPNLVTYTYAYQPTTGTRVTFLATRNTYRWAGAALVLVSHRQVTIRGAQNPALAAYSGVSCGGLPQYQLKR